MISLALDVSVQQGQTLRPLDKQKILNSIAQRYLTLPPDMKHESYAKYNQRLRAMLALGFWRRVMMGTGEHSETQQLQMKLATALKNDEWRERLDISMAYMPGSDIDEKVSMAAKSFPAHLKHLSLDLQGTDITNDTLSALATALPRSLETLTLDLNGNPKIENIGVENLTKLPPNITKLTTSLEGTAVSKELVEKRNCLDDIKQHIMDEAERGCWCNQLNLCPSPTGKPKPVTAKYKLAIPDK